MASGRCGCVRHVWESDSETIHTRHDHCKRNEKPCAPFINCSTGWMNERKKRSTYRWTYRLVSRQSSWDVNGKEEEERKRPEENAHTQCAMCNMLHLICCSSQRRIVINCYTHSNHCHCRSFRPLFCVKIKMCCFHARVHLAETIAMDKLRQPTHHRKIFRECARVRACVCEWVFGEHNWEILCAASVLNRVDNNNIMWIVKIKKNFIFYYSVRSFVLSLEAPHQSRCLPQKSCVSWHTFWLTESDCCSLGVCMCRIYLHLNSALGRDLKHILWLKQQHLSFNARCSFVDDSQSLSLFVRCFVFCRLSQSLKRTSYTTYSQSTLNWLLLYY